MITIIVPVYKTEPFINRCIDSVLAQTYSDWEMLLIEDGSPDNSGIICDEYAQKDSRIHVFHKSNEGVSSARNLGLDNAKGEWITFVDSDDYILPNFLADLIVESSADLVASGHKRFGRETCEYLMESSKKYSIMDYVDGLVLMRSSENNYFCVMSYPWGKLLKRNIIEDNNIRFDTKMKLSEDSCFMLNYLSHCRDIICVKGGSYMYYVMAPKLYVMTFEEYENHRNGIIEAIAKIQRYTNVKTTNYRNSFIALYTFALLRYLKSASSYKVSLIQKHYKKYSFTETFDIIKKSRPSFTKALLFSLALYFQIPLKIIKSHL